MTDILESVKKSIGIIGEYQDGTVMEHIAEARRYLIAGGVPDYIAEHEISVGVISRGVDDLWNFGSGNLSPYFKQRAGQLAYEISSGKYIVFYQGDYGEKFSIPIGFTLQEEDKVIFSCEEIEKEFSGTEDYILIDLTNEESQTLIKGTYTWKLKVQNENMSKTVMADGVLIVR